MSKKTKTKKRGKHQARRRLMLVVALPVAAVLLILCAYSVNKLLVTDICVEGDSRYAASLIERTSGVEAGQRILLTRRGQVRESILSELPYIEDVRVRIELPSTVRIIVTQATPLCVMQLPEGPRVIGDTWRILGVEESSHAGLPHIDMELPAEQQTGSVLEFISESSRRLCVDILSGLQDNNIIGEVSQIDLSSPVDISFGYKGRFTVRLGSRLGMEAKLRLVAATAGTLDESARGVLDATTEGTVSFRPERKGSVS